MSGDYTTTVSEDEIEFAPDLPKVEPDGAFALRASEVQREQVEWLWPGRIPFGHVTALVGPPGLGKSLLTCLLAGRLSRGELGDPCDVVLATAEDSLAATVRPRLEAVEADLERVHFLRVRRDGIDGDVSLPDDVDELRRLVGELGPCLVVIDPLMAHLMGSVDAHRDQHVRRALAPLHHLAQESGCGVLGVLHLNKGSGTDPLLRTGGSVGLVALVRSAHLLARDPEDPAGEAGTSRVLAHFKSNLGPLAPSLRFEVVPTLLPANGSEPDVQTARLAERGVCDATASDLLQGAKEAMPREAAQDWLRANLPSEGEEKATLVLRAEAAGFSERTLRRAADELGVVREQTAVGKPWLWRLPSGHTGEDEAGQTVRGQTESDASGHEAGQTDEPASDAAERHASVPSGHTLARRTDDARLATLATPDDGGQTDEWQCPRCGKPPLHTTAGIAYCSCGVQEVVGETVEPNLLAEFRREEA